MLSKISYRISTETFKPLNENQLEASVQNKSYQKIQLQVLPCCVCLFHKSDQGQLASVWFQRF